MNFTLLPQNLIFTVWAEFYTLLQLLTNYLSSIAWIKFNPKLHASANFYTLFNNMFNYMYNNLRLQL